jgi:carbamoyl-phosphate synthase large subunit
MLRRTALAYKIPIITTIAGAKATAAAICSLQATTLDVKAIQDYLKAAEYQVRATRTPVQAAL